jgi:hypothetical protein
MFGCSVYASRGYGRQPSFRPDQLPRASELRGFYPRQTTYGASAQRNVGAALVSVEESRRRYSLDEYFAVEETSHVKNEYYDGQIFAMAGASLAHHRISRNILTYLQSALANLGCEAFGSDLRVQAPGGLFTYPDISMVCREPQLRREFPVRFEV